MRTSATRSAFRLLLLVAIAAVMIAGICVLGCTIYFPRTVTTAHYEGMFGVAPKVRVMVGSSTVALSHSVSNLVATNTECIVVPISRFDAKGFVQLDLCPDPTRIRPGAATRPDRMLVRLDIVDTKIMREIQPSESWAETNNVGWPFRCVQVRQVSQLDKYPNFVDADISDGIRIGNYEAVRHDKKDGLTFLAVSSYRSLRGVVAGRIEWLAFIANIMLFVVALKVAIWLPFAAIRHYRKLRHRCTNCGYPRTDNAPVCSECGVRA